MKYFAVSNKNSNHMHYSIVALYNTAILPQVHFHVTLGSQLRHLQWTGNARGKYVCLFTDFSGNQMSLECRGVDGTLPDLPGFSFGLKELSPSSLHVLLNLKAEPVPPR